MAGMIPLSMMNQNYQKYQQGSQLPPARPFYAPGEEPAPPMGRAGYDEFGNPDPRQFTEAPRMHNSLSELALSQNPNLSAEQMQQVNADWERPELFEDENAARIEAERQLNADPDRNAYPGPRGSLATRGQGADTLNAMQPIGQGPGLEITGAYQNPHTIQPMEMEKLKIEKEVEKLAKERKKDDSMRDFLQRIYAMGQQLQSNSGPMAAFNQMAQGAKEGYTPYTAQKR